MCVLKGVLLAFPRFFAVAKKRASGKEPLAGRIMPLSNRPTDDQMLPAAKGFSARRNRRSQLVQRSVEMLFIGEGKGRDSFTPLTLRSE